MQRPQRNRKAPVPLYVPDANQVMEDDYSDDGGDDGGDDDDDGESIGSSDTDVSYSGSEPNEYQYDDFVVPDDASLSTEDQQKEDEGGEEASFSGSDESSESEESDENSETEDATSDAEMTEAPGV